ncbi:MAG: NADH-quinone oxidoreductase subunit M [Gammaproteobacteria bacterium]|nr:MAG: NADH-quinone oxidoreductase subunit M [Gammaproteobacteria bacterium]
MITDWPILTTLILLPIVGGVIVLMLDSNLAKKLSLFFALLTLILSLPLYIEFDTSTALMQFSENYQWLSVFNIRYSLGIDGFSMPLIILTTITTLLVIIASWQTITYKTSQYMAAFLIMEGLMIGVFCALDSIVFYVFWEAMLIPMFLIIGIWGGKNRVYATIKFFLYTFLGSVFMLIALIYMGNMASSFAILDFHSLKLNNTEQILIFLAFLIAFAVKVPMWPVHTWLPDAHVEAPTGGSAILAAIMLKMGTYGFLRFSLPITPDAASQLDLFVITLSLIAVVYIGFVALAQHDMKKLIAYSSISHMGFVTLGIFISFAIINNQDIAGAALGIEGAMVQMISHGFISAAMFLSVGVLYDRMHSRKIADYGGVINTMPIFGAFVVFFAMANAGLPGTSGFVGEFMVILASIKANFWYAVLAATTLIIGAAYTLWMVKRVFYGEVKNENVTSLKDINKRELLVLASLALFILIIGVYPDILTRVMHATTDNLLQHISISKIK